VNVNVHVNEPEELLTQRSQRELLSPYHRGPQRKPWENLSHAKSQRRAISVFKKQEFKGFLGVLGELE
jgi:hypothetical protein